MSPAEAESILASADLICSAEEVRDSVSRLARELNAAMRGRNPLVVSVMGGAVVFTGQLLPQLDFPLDFDYVHATRYGDATSGGQLKWVVEPRTAVAGRTVLLLDDILDEGITLAAIRDHLMEAGAVECVTAVFADKDIGRDKPLHADYVGLTLPNRYVFGFGMDVSGAWRNLPAIYAVRE
ncbi:MAG TPA: hypoxanthine-guanine phosphoribosyltransferase [Rhodocyclaceae bacterium]|jgi:hypoxanthine phosphoribosyltransferase|nr:hypoxanthine-guanine phosphoribosyltransferase [Rhodocyclaceae bacterium]